MGEFMRPHEVPEAGYSEGSSEEEIKKNIEEFITAGKELDSLSYDKGREKEERMGIVEMFELSKSHPEIVSYFESIAVSDMLEKEKKELLELERKFLIRTINEDEEKKLADLYAKFKRDLH